MVAAERDKDVLASFCIPMKTVARFWPPLENQIQNSLTEPKSEQGLYLVGLNVNGQKRELSWRETNLADVWLRGKGLDSILLNEIEVGHGGGDGFGGATGTLPVEAQYSFPFEFRKRRRHVLEPPLMIYPDDRDTVRFQLGLYPAGSFTEWGGSVTATLLYQIGTGETGQLPLTPVPAGWKLLSRATGVPIPLRFPRVIGICEVTPWGALRGTIPGHEWESVPRTTEFDENWLARPNYFSVLTSALLDADTETRLLAIRSLGRLGSKDSLEALSYCLSDEKKAVREAAAAALTAIDSEHGWEYVARQVIPIVAAPLYELSSRFNEQGL